MEKEEMWQAVLAQLQFHISKANFATWLKGTSIIEKKDGQVVVGTPNNFSKEWIQTKYHKLIQKILRNLDEEVKEVKYTVTGGGLKISPVNLYDTTEETEFQPRFQEFTIQKETGLNPRYRLENFVVGPFNELAHAAALAVLKNPGESYNPLFIYGGVGLGKTHLLQAIGNELLQKESNKTIRYVSSEKLISQVVNSIKNRTIEKLKAAYLPIDVLIVDDIQFFSGKEKSQEEFFHIFNALYAQNKQIILSSDRAPKAISSLEDRLRSRFEGGMIADIGYPDLETRMAILKTKASEKRAHFPEEVFNFIATNFPKNIRELEGALNRLIAFQELNKKTPDLQTAKALLKNILIDPLKRVNHRKIIQAVAEFYDLKEEDLLDSSRKKEIVVPRQIAMYLLREELKCSYPFIGRKFGGKDHTTIIHACEKIAKEIQQNEKFAEEIELIKQRISS
jgi:chromosomal replication initiator protein